MGQIWVLWRSAPYHFEPDVILGRNQPYLRQSRSGSERSTLWGLVGIGNWDFGAIFGANLGRLGPSEIRSHSTANPMSFWAEIRHLCDNPKRIRGNPLYGVRRGLGIGIFGAVLELFGVAGCTATRPVSHRRPPSPAPSCPPSGSASPATPRGAARAASTARVASEVPPPSLESVSFGVLFGVIYGFFGFLGGFGGFRWFFDGFPLGFC